MTETATEVCERLFPEAFKASNYYSGYCYGSLIEKMGTVLIEASDCDYQGSSFYLLSDGGNRLGYLEFGWGSCSGCDALEACSSKQDLGELFVSLRDSIRWFDGAEAFKTWAREHDWKGEWSWHDGAQEFIREINKQFGLDIHPDR